MGLSTADLENLTPREFNLMREGYELDQKYQWERARFGAYWTYRMNVSDPVSIEKFRPLDQADIEAPDYILSKIPDYTSKQQEYLNTLFNPDK